MVITIVRSVRFTLIDLKMVNLNICWFEADNTAVMLIQRTGVFPPPLGT